MDGLVQITKLLAQISVILIVSTSFSVCACPTGCTCDPPNTLSCTQIDRIPDYSTKANIEKLEISNHNITELTATDLEGFTSLKRLYLAVGKITTVENGTFDAFKDTIIEINLSRNKISEIPSDLFKDMPNLKLINVTSNQLKTIRNGTFVNLGQLSNLFLELNQISILEDECMTGVDNLDNVNLFHNQLTTIPIKALNSAKNLRHLELSFNQLTEIPEVLDGHLASLEELNLESNPISSLKVFPNVSSSLKILNLQFTNIKTTDKTTWRNVPNLEELHLSGTLLTELKHGMFEGLHKMEKLFLMSLRHLTMIGPNTFSNLTNLASIHLSFNKLLSQIHEQAFASLNISDIYLRENKLTTFQENLLNWTAIQFVSVGGNPINCDCNLAWMFKPEYARLKDTFSDLICSVPLKYSDKHLMDLQATDLTCGKTDRERFATGIAVAVFCFLFFAILLVLFKCRKNIQMRCRRYFMYKKYQNDLVFTVENDTSIGELDDGDTRPLKELRLDTN